MSVLEIFYKFKFNLFKTETLDDFSDRLSFIFSCYILTIASVAVIFKQYFIRPISCYIATEVGGKFLISYMENYCWVEGTIPIQFFDNFPTNEQEWKKIEDKKILYYQWVPFILSLQALLCYLPQLIWRLFYINNNGKHMDYLISKANKAVFMDDENIRSKEINHLAKVLENMIFVTRDMDHQKSCIQSGLSKFYEIFILGKRTGAYLMIFYLFIKFLYLSNAIGQIFLIQSFLCVDMKERMFFGTKILHDIVNGRDWEVTSTFPRIGFCQARLRNYGATNYVVAQCALPVNMLNEKIYIFLWFWMVLLSCISLISIITWICKLFVQYYGKSFLMKYLKLSGTEKCGKINGGLLRKFERKFLKHNGLFVLRMISTNSGDLITAEIINQMWNTYKSKNEKKKDQI